MTKITIVVPAFNEEKRIEKVLQELSKTNLQIVVVDDGSTDGTDKVLRNLKFKISNLKLLRHEVNLGKGEALKTGCDAAFMIGADAVVVMDSDGQHDIRDLSKFVNTLKEKKYDILFGVRKFNKNMPLVRKLGNMLTFKIIEALFGIKLRDILCGYRGFTKSGYQKIRWISSGYAVEIEMIARTAKNNLRFCEIPVATVYYEVYKGLSAIDSIGILLETIAMRFRI